MSTALGATSAQSNLLAGLLTADHTPEPQNSSSKKREEAPAAKEQRSKAPQDVGKNPRVPKPSSGSFFVQETPHTDVTLTEFYPNAFDDDTGSLSISDDGNRMEVDFKPQPNQFHLKMYNKATPYLFNLKDPIDCQRIEEMNEKIVKTILKLENQLIPLLTIIKTLKLYE